MSSNKHWDQTVGQIESGAFKGWLDYEFVEREYIRPQVSGDSAISYLDYFVDCHLPARPVPSALSLGCGGGNLERALIDMNAVEVIDGYEASPASVQLARELAGKEGMADRIHYQVQDINRITLSPKQYDFVIVKMALHHFTALERIYHQVCQSLKPNGLFVFNEYIGPARFQWTPRQVDLMMQLIQLFPENLRWNAVTQKTMNEIKAPPVRYMASVDPSEAVRSADIMPLLGHYFEIIEYKPYGGTLLNTVLTFILPNFQLDNAEHQSLIRKAFEFEQNAIRAGEIQSDFAYVVARPRSDVIGLKRPISNHLKIASENAYGRVWFGLSPMRRLVKQALGRK
jgi:SAM-dependent methyltransferase